MNRHLRKIALAALIIACLALSAQANPTHSPRSISINFGANEPTSVRSDILGPAGVLGTLIWNNLDGANGSVTGLVDDTGSATSVNVSWTSAGTGANILNNTAPPGGERDLMTGGISTDLSVTITGLNAAGFGSSGYDVYEYFYDFVISAPFDGTYVLNNNYYVFEAPPGVGDFLALTISGGQGGYLHGIELVQNTVIPAPGALLLGSIGLGFVSWLRRRRTL